MHVETSAVPNGGVTEQTRRVLKQGNAISRNELLLISKLDHHMPNQFLVENES